MINLNTSSKIHYLMNNQIPSREDIKKGIDSQIFDVIVIGGGITGASVARDAIMRGLSVALFEKKDFASGTSSMTSKMIHGGLRYLLNYEFRLVREAALERKVAIETAPHLAEAMEFLVPLYKWNKESMLLFRLGLFAYDALAFPKQIGKHKMLSTKKLVDALPILANDELKGGASYFDVKSDDSRLTLTNILYALAGGAKALNYSKVIEWNQVGDDSIEVQVHDEISNENYSAKGKSLVISGGPWTDLIEAKGKNFKGKAKIRMTRGTHILLDKKVDLPYSCLLVNDDSRPIFLIPRINNKILAGTTDVDYKGDPDDIAPTQDDIDYILDATNKIFPAVNFTHENIQSSFTGVRPLVYEEGADERKTSRNHTIFVQDQVITVLGGKLTTARVMAKQVVDKLVKKVLKLPSRHYKCLTDKMPHFAGEIDDWPSYYAKQMTRLQEEHNISMETADMLVRWYGSELPFFEKILQEQGTNLLVEKSPWLEAQVVYSCRVEHIQHPVDFLRRRTPIMLERGNGLQCLGMVAEIMKEELSWTDEYKSQMIDETKEYVNTFIAINKS